MSYFDNKTILVTGGTGFIGTNFVKELSQHNVKIIVPIHKRTLNFQSDKIETIHADLTKIEDCMKVCQNVDYIFHAAGMVSAARMTVNNPMTAISTNLIVTLRILEAIKSSNLIKKTKFYQAGTSEMYGKVQQIPQTEKTNFYPRSPYGVAKVFSHWMTINYREAYNMFACNGILFNHESPRRGETFVTRKVTIALCKIKLGLQKKLLVGNLNAKRDWGHAKDYIEAQWLMLQQKKPDDFVIATGKNYSVKYFINVCAELLGIKLKWVGKGINMKAFDQNGKCIIECDKRYYRPTEVETLLGDSSKAKKLLKWKPKISFKSLVKEMVESDYKNLQNISSEKK